MGRKVIKVTPGLIQGVSQQPASLRTPGQGERQENAISSPSEGLKKRSGSERIASLSNWPTVSTGEVKTHFIDRDVSERFVVALGDQSQNGDNTIKIYDFIDGSVNLIKDLNGDPAVSADFTYLDCSDPSKDLELLTIADFTFVVNKTITPVMKPALSNLRSPEGLMVINAGNYANSYELTISNSTPSFARTVRFKTNDATNSGNEEFIKTDYIAEKIAASLTGPPPTVSNATDGASITVTGTALTPADWSITVEASVIHITRSPAWIAANPTLSADFDMKAKDGVSSTNTTVIKNTIQTFLELPKTSANGFVIKIDGSPEVSNGGYYAKFITTNGEAFGDGLWEETVAGGIEYIIDETTMPHLLIRLSNGDFLWTPATGNTYTFGGVSPVEVFNWTNREVGDDKSNPVPSFIGGAIQALSYFKDRLIMLSSDNIAISSAGDFFTFWRTTVIDLLDSERIDITSSHTRVTKLSNAIPTKEQLVLFSDTTQFSLRGETILTPKTVAISPVSEHESDRFVPPVSIGSSIFMASNRGDFSIVRELVDRSQNKPFFEISEVMAHIPSYIKGRILSLEASKTENLLAATSDGDRKTVTVYKFFVNAGDRVQNSWSRFNFSGDIIHMSFVDSLMVLVVKRGTEYDLETIDLEPFKFDIGQLHKTLLDRRITNTALVSAVYDPVLKQTVFTLPYTVPIGTDMVVVTPAGKKLQQLSSTSTTITVSGDHSTISLFFGESFTMIYEFSKIKVSLPGSTKGVQPMRTGLVNLSWGHLEYEDSSFFKIQVTAQNQPASVYIFNGYIAGGALSLIGSLPISSGIFDFGVLSPADDVKIELLNDSHLPSRFVSLELEARIETRGLRL